jgi:hypothetical protein
LIRLALILYGHHEGEYSVIRAAPDGQIFFSTAGGIILLH